MGAQDGGEQVRRMQGTVEYFELRLFIHLLNGDNFVKLDSIWVFEPGTECKTSRIGIVAEWSKALALGASPKGRGFEPHQYQ